LDRGAAIGFRLHVDWKSVGEVGEVMKDLEDRKLLDNPKCTIGANPKHAWHLGQAEPEYPNMTLNEVRETFGGLPGTANGKRLGVTTERIPDKLKTYSEKGLGGIVSNPDHCGSVTGAMHTLDPFGAIYCCWDTAGRREDQVGEYSEKGAVFFERAADWKGRCPATVPECSTCKYVMFHFGGCAALASAVGSLERPACYHYEDSFLGLAREYFIRREMAPPEPPPSAQPDNTLVTV
jgi:uncharacterized protein